MENLAISTNDIDGGDLSDEKYSTLVTAGEWAFDGCDGHEGGWGGARPTKREAKRLPFVVGVPKDNTRDHLANAVRELFREGLVDSARKGLLVFEGDLVGKLPRLNERFMDSNLEEDWGRDSLWQRDDLDQDVTQRINIVKWRKAFRRKHSGTDEYNVVRVQQVIPANRKELIPCKLVQSGNKTIFRFNKQHGLTEQGYIVKVDHIHPSIDGIHCVDLRISLHEFAIFGLPQVHSKLLLKVETQGGPTAPTAAIVTVLWAIDDTRIVYHIRKRAEYPWEWEAGGQGWARGMNEEQAGGVYTGWGDANPSKDGANETGWGDEPLLRDGATDMGWGNENTWKAGACGDENVARGGAYKMGWGSENPRSGGAPNAGWGNECSQQQRVGGSSTAGFGGLGNYAWGRDGSECGQPRRPFFGYTNRQSAGREMLNSRVDLGRGSVDCHQGNHTTAQQQGSQHLPGSKVSADGCTEWEGGCAQPGVDLLNGKRIRMQNRPENQVLGDSWGMANFPQKSVSQPANQSSVAQRGKVWNLRDIEGYSPSAIGMQLMDLCGRERMGKFLVGVMAPRHVKWLERLASDFVAPDSPISTHQPGHCRATGLTFKAAGFQKAIAADVMQMGSNWILRLPTNRTLYMVAELMRHYFLRYPCGRVLILVQKLVQGAGYHNKLETLGFERVGLRTQIHNAQSMRLMNWKASLEAQFIMIMTPQLFLNYISTTAASFSDFGLVFLDECEFAVGMNSACMLMNRFDELFPQERDNVQVVGITSSEVLNIKYVCKNLRVPTGNVIKISDLDPRVQDSAPH